MRSSTVSKQIGFLCSEFFGVFLNVTSLRAINNTAVNNACAHGHINDSALKDYNTECQGHSTRMGKKLYDHSKEPDRAKTLQQINDLIIKKCQDSVDSDDAYSGVGSDVDSDDDTNLLFREKRKRDIDNENNGNDMTPTPKKKKISNDEQLLAKYEGDWGKKHPCYGSNALRIKWSPFEKDYIKAMVDIHPPSKCYIWRHCLDSILNTNDENVRHQFHVQHLNVVKLKDAIRVKK